MMQSTEFASTPQPKGSDALNLSEGYGGSPMEKTVGVSANISMEKSVGIFPPKEGARDRAGIEGTALIYRDTPGI